MDVALFFIAPHRLRPLDVEFITDLAELVPVVSRLRLFALCQDMAVASHWAPQACTHILYSSTPGELQMPRHMRSVWLHGTGTGMCLYRPRTDRIPWHLLHPHQEAEMWVVRVVATLCRSATMFRLMWLAVGAGDIQG